jgi:hypothetical protein
MNERKPRGIAWDDDFWYDMPSLGAVINLSGDGQVDPPTILVPDRERGGWKDHYVVKPRRRLGF